MKKLVFTLIVLAVVVACTTAKSNVTAVDKKEVTKNDTVRIANDSLEYEVIVTDPGFSTYLASVARPRNYYGLAYLENRNLFFVSEYNRRVLDPFRYSSNLYEMRIDYQSNIDYGYEVNYLLYNYFMFFQQAYRQKL